MSVNFYFRTKNHAEMLASHPHRGTYEKIESVLEDIGFNVHVLSTTYDSCVVIAPNRIMAEVTRDILRGQGIDSKIIPGHFIDAYYLPIRYV